MLKNAEQILKFYAAHRDNPSAQVRMLLVRNLWVGQTPEFQGDLAYGSSSWPVTIIDRILWLCTNLKSFFLVDFDQNLWYRLEDALPASLEHLAMGPVHGPFRINNLKNKPRIHTFTSVKSYMRDDEVRDIIMFPYMRRFRRISKGTDQIWALEQLACTSESKTIKEIELIVCDGLWPTQFIPILRHHTDDERVVIRNCGDKSWIQVLYAKFLDEKTVLLGRISSP